jgi:NitT/TauT family transport system permease protein
MLKRNQVILWSPWLLLIAIIAVWQILCSAFDVSEFIFPSPWRIWTQFWEFRDNIAGHAWRTFWVTMVGFALAIVVGVLLGFVIGSSRLAYAAVYPVMTAFNALPKAAFVPILVVWFGIGVGPAILTAFLISFFPIMVNIATGLATLEPELETSCACWVPSAGTFWSRWDCRARCLIFTARSKSPSRWRLSAPRSVK